MPDVPQPVDIDALLAEEFKDEKPKPLRTAPVTLFGQTFRVVQDVNAYNVVQLSNPDEVIKGVARILANSIHDDDKDRFQQLLSAQRNLSDKKLMTIFTRIMEVAASDHPTDSSSDSGRTTVKKAATKRSVARSSAGA